MLTGVDSPRVLFTPIIVVIQLCTVKVGEWAAGKLGFGRGWGFIRIVHLVTVTEWGRYSDSDHD